MRVPFEVDVPTPIINITLPANVPLVCDVKEAEKLFGVSKTTLYGLAKTHSDFPVKSIGRGMKFLVPDLYVWFRDYPERTIPTEKSAAQLTAGRHKRKNNGQ